MTDVAESTPTSPTKIKTKIRTKGRAEKLLEELVVDIVITAAIVWALVLLGEPLTHVLKSPLFIILTAGGVAHLAHKTLRHETTATDD